MTVLNCLQNVINVDLPVFCLKERIKKVISTLEGRVNMLNVDEPQSDGQAHDKWEDKVSELEDIIFNLENLVEDALTKDEIVDGCIDAMVDLEFYQNDYGGVARLNVRI